MTKILFVCHGNICRSPMAEFIFKDMVSRAGCADEFLIDSAAVSAEELGNPVYPPARRVLNAHGISCEDKAARRVRPEDGNFDLIIAMDQNNIARLRRFFGEDCGRKIKNLLDYAGREGEEIADPWYTDDFDAAWNDIYAGCEGLFRALGPVELDFSHCTQRSELYEVLRREMEWDEDWGSNLDALWDVVTGMKHRGEWFRVTLPEDEALRAYALRICDTLTDAGKKVES